MNTFFISPNVLYAELVSIFYCLATFQSLPGRSGYKELFPVRTFLTVSQSRDGLNTDDVKRITLQRYAVEKFCLI